MTSNAAENLTLDQFSKYRHYDSLDQITSNTLRRSTPAWT